MPRDVWGAYVTQSDYEEAKKNGISRNTLNFRISSGWKIKKAITTPIMRRKSEKYILYENLAISNGINAGTFRSRVRIGWTLEDSANMPIFSNKERAIKANKANNEKRKGVPESSMKEAKKNGICYKTLYSRLLRGVPMSEAISIPPRGRKHHWIEQNKLIFTKQN